jgi:hypothetical protein
LIKITEECGIVKVEINKLEVLAYDRRIVEGGASPGNTKAERAYSISLNQRWRIIGLQGR